MEIDTLSVLENSPPRPETPFNDLHDPQNSLVTDAEKGIVVDAPSINLAGPSAMMVGQDDDDDEEVVPFVVKRKRNSINYNLDDLGYSRRSPYTDPPAKRPKQSQKIRGVIIGVWRDSDLPDDADKHVIYGFIDIHDRLRTRIYGMNRRGEELVANAPTGAGGCWVTFERVIFDSHLQGLTSAEVKEYVKIRSESKPELNLEERAEADAKAVLRAKAIVAQQEAASPGGAKPVVHRAPRQSLGNRHSLPRQTPNKTPSFQAVNAADMQTPKTSPSIEKPTGVLLGYWADSSELLEADKHAVYGVLSGTDCFRVKVQKVTRDGRYVEGNFPVGAGAIWLHFEKVVLDPHLATLERAEVKEYCRIRQQDLEHRESDKERKVNELKAVQKAKAVVAEQKLNGRIAPEPQAPERVVPEMELRQSARFENKVSSKHQPVDESAILLSQKEKSEARERQLEKTRKEVAMAEAAQRDSEPDIHEAAHMELKNNIKKLNKVWVAQQQVTMSGTMSPAFQPAPQAENEVRYHNGIKYERKPTGPFQGKLVSQAQILNIDGEDYVEYRILTKPSF